MFLCVTGTILLLQVNLWKFLVVPISVHSSQSNSFPQDATNKCVTGSLWGVQALLGILNSGFDMQEALENC